MRQSHVSSFSDPYAFAAAFPWSQVSIVLKNKGAFRNEMTVVGFPRLRLMRNDENVPAIMRSATTVKNRTALLFLSDPDQGSFQLGSMEMSPADMLIYGQGATNYYRTSGPFRVAYVSLADDDLAAAGQAIAGCPLTFPAQPHIVRPPPSLLSRLTAIHAATGQLAKAAPDFLAKPSVTNALEQELVHAIVRCLADPTTSEPRHDATRHTRVISRFEEFLALKRYEPLYLAEICAAIGVSERALRACCHEHLGVGPVRYLWLRRMNLAHRALLRADLANTTVTAIATDHGFWELGRFSVDYRSLFGETPSATLHRPREERARPPPRH
jgi:AraC-like DNA-binding protein